MGQTCVENYVTLFILSSVFKTNTDTWKKPLGTKKYLNLKSAGGCYLDDGVMLMSWKMY